LLIGGFLCSLVILQSSKEAATMRVLGATKLKTRAMLTLEQALLGAGGLALGAGAMLMHKGTGLAAIAGRLYAFAALYFGTVVAAAVACAVLATHRSPLELLQTKE
jgi:ABC-type antimicrobial peptide transport system permease subunit